MSRRFQFKIRRGGVRIVIKERERERSRESFAAEESGGGTKGVGEGKEENSPTVGERTKIICGIRSPVETGFL